MADYSIKQGDTWPPLEAALKKQDGQPIDLTEAVGVKIWMKTGVTLVETDPCTIEDAASGRVSYIFSAEDTATLGEYQLEFDIDWGDGKKQSVPNTGFNTLEVTPALDIT